MRNDLRFRGKAAADNTQINFLFTADEVTPIARETLIYSCDFTESTCITSCVCVPQMGHERVLTSSEPNP